MTSRLPFRRRIFVVLVLMTTVPTVLAVAGWVLSVRRLLPAAGARASTERVAATARLLLDGEACGVVAEERFRAAREADGRRDFVEVVAEQGALADGEVERVHAVEEQPRGGCHALGGRARARGR